MVAQAGAPQVATPMFADQFYWGRRIKALGIGSATPFTGLTADTLAAALNQALAPAVAARAKALKIATDGATIAARSLEEEFG